jgi:hypothetical protein
VKDQHARPPRRRGFIPGEISAQIDGVVVVVDVARLHGWSASSKGNVEVELHTGLKMAQPEIWNIRCPRLFAPTTVFGENQP